MAETTYEIYKITNKINGKQYVGQTRKGTLNRFNQHIKADTLIGSAIRKYGYENFDIEVVDMCKTQEEANRLEEKHIGIAGCIVPDGYNMNEYGRLVGHITAKYTVWFNGNSTSILKDISTNIIGYIYRITELIKKDYTIRKNRETKITTWTDLWEEIGCTNKRTIRQIRDVIVENNMIIKTKNGLVANEEVFAVYY